MTKIFNHNAELLRRKLDSLCNNYDWDIDNVHRYTIFFDKVGHIIDDDKRLGEFNKKLKRWEANTGIPIKIFEMELNQINHMMYKGIGGRVKIKRKIETTDATGFKINKYVTIDWYRADQELRLIVHWCYCYINQLAYDYDVDIKSIFKKDFNASKVQ